MSFAFTAEDMSRLTPDQKAAVVGTCMAAVFADGQIDPAEASKFEAAFAAVPWGIPAPQVERMIQLVYLKLSTLSSPEAASEFIRRTADTLPGPAMKEKAFALAAKVCYVETPMNQSTRNVLDALAQAMQISLPRIAQIAAEVKRE